MVIGRESWNLSDAYSVAQGVGGEAVSGMRVQHSTLDWLDLGGHRYKDLVCLHAAAEGNGMDLSCYTLGFFCGDFLLRSHTWFDYRQKRMAIVPVSANIEESTLEESE